MNTKVALLGAIEIISSLGCGILILLLTYRLITIYGQKVLAINHGNTAYNILITGVLFSVGYVVSGVIQPIIDAFRLLSDTNISTAQLILQFVGYGGLYIAIAYISSIIISMIGVYTYTYMTPLDELKEIKNNNIGVGLTVSIIIVVLALMTKGGIILLVESLVPYPDLPPK
ncbi:MAG: hypothetical protein COA58_15400 [Bacteroidetes bacterium]|nr:MAG: hypothetical protein COA58_15400 [Bacteroidota bacterium]